MSEWWTYAPSDFLMFSPRTYWRLVAAYNAEVWPAHLVGLAAGLGALWLALKHPRFAMLVVAAAWAWVGCAFHWERYADINLAARYFAAACAVQAALLVVAPASRAPRWGWPIAVLAVLAYPVAGLLLERPIEVFGVMPEPTALATIGLVSRWWLRVIPVASLAVGWGTLWLLAA